MAGTGGTFKVATTNGSNVVTLSFPGDPTHVPPIPPYEEDYTVSDKLLLVFTGAPKSSTFDTSGTAPSAGTVTVRK